ncbi:MAG: sigma-70 family RNA polymerase sigma factor [Hespellia sp.]|nr:sigma-70 family RNA polymerase sigma factor [Hespellia sp.]
MRLQTEELMERYKDNIFAAAFSICKNASDADDVVQDTFIRYHTIEKQFDDEQHIKAWLIRVAINQSKNIVSSFWRRNKESLDNYIETLAFETPETENLFETVMSLKEKYRIVIHLFYYEDYSIREISAILNVSESNVKVRLTRGRRMLKLLLKEEWNDDDK